MGGGFNSREQLPAWSWQAAYFSRRLPTVKFPIPRRYELEYPMVPYAIHQGVGHGNWIPLVIVSVAAFFWICTWAD